jgi:hypothetical protein
LATLTTAQQKQLIEITQTKPWAIGTVLLAFDHEKKQQQQLQQQVSHIFPVFYQNICLDYVHVY